MNAKIKKIKKKGRGRNLRATSRQGKEAKVRRTKILQEEGFTLIYRLYETKRPSGSVYSVSVSAEGDAAERTHAMDITRKYTRANEIFYLLWSNAVMPCHLTEVLEDIL